ncbi:MAG: hypothetical protein ACR2OX_06165, partial [Methyloligellaceae bacterium]
MTRALRTRRFLSYLAALVLIALSAALVMEIASPGQADAQSSVRPPAGATVNTGPAATGLPNTDARGRPTLPEKLKDGKVPGGSLGGKSSSEMWRAVRKGVKGTVSIPDKKAGQLVQSEGDNWRAKRNGPLSTWGVLG